MGQQVTQAEYARRKGWAKSYVTKLKQAGRLVMTSRGLVDVDATEQRLAETDPLIREDTKARHAEARAAKSGPATPPPQGAVQTPPPNQPPQTPSDDDDRAASSFRKSKAVKENYLALKAKAEYEKSIGQLCDTEAARTAGAEVGAVFRNGLEGLAETLAPELAAMDDRDAVHGLLVEQFEQVLASVSEHLERSAKRMTP